MKYQPITEERSVSPNAIIDALAEGGVRYVLGMPGGLTGPPRRALYQHPVTGAIQVREESIGASDGGGDGPADRSASSGHGAGRVDHRQRRTGIHGGPPRQLAGG